MSAVLRLGIVGCGWAAGEIARVAADLPRLRIIAATDADPARAEAFASKLGAHAVAALDDLLADAMIDALYVGLPHHLLAPVVERALLAGKHVLAEKPLALVPDAARRLGALAQERNLKLAVFFELRRAGTVQLARKLLADGAIGQPRLVRIRTVIDKPLSYWGAPGRPLWRASVREAGGGVLLMNSIHQLDTLRYVTGLDYVRASGEIATFAAPDGIEVDVENTASATLRLSNGGLVNLVATAHSPGARREETIEIDGAFGRLDLPDPFGTLPVRLYRAADGKWAEPSTERPDSHALMLAAFVDAALDGIEVPASADDAAAAIAAVMAIYRSAAEGRAVDIPVL